MKKLLEFILTGIVGDKNFEIEEGEDSSSPSFLVKTPSETTGIIIGKVGKTIKAIRTLLRVKATLEGKGVYVSVEPKDQMDQPAKKEPEVPTQRQK